ncbi:serine/threonine protein phosphatase [Magnetospirillum sp. UT-4]|uniref:serine/threonine protein phosphatase n=1 Tax=Magnetospirillum sp. UT-4 TaxID=2681467 RepID=UPI001381D6EA|nr:serine/threonine protein phosphatase [Magnetospirillum sp. UT-4]CAA7616371.1 putative Metallophosphoesterase [Magnetospirillum sp. UT-4]
MTIRLAILSDLHVEKGPYAPPPFEADLVVLAGDIGWGGEGVAWIADHLHGRPAVYVAGNREYWHHKGGADPHGELRAAAARVPGLAFLHDDEVVFELAGRRLRVLGCTLWTDWALTGDPEGAMAKAAASMPDYKNGRGPGGVALVPAQTRAWSGASAAFLERALTTPFDGTTLVVTHHLPTARSLKALRPEHVPTTASVTGLDALIEAHGPEIWVHGHSHWDCDYRLGRTRMVSNQRGAPENEGYRPLMVEV